VAFLQDSGAYTPIDADGAALDRNAHAIRHALDHKQGAQGGDCDLANVDHEGAIRPRLGFESASATSEHKLYAIVFVPGDSDLGRGIKRDGG
jgi:hypothetical protein